ncbi:MAG: hypothetical protein P1V21_25575 [Rhizobiaceae bacterium]|nr:hypothetical protein [Rhizobiaceae bacterium]
MHNDNGRAAADLTDRRDAARAMTKTNLLARAQQSELVTSALEPEFQELVPPAVRADVSGAVHKVAGIRNDRFQLSIVDYLVYVDLSEERRSL